MKRGVIDDERGSKKKKKRNDQVKGSRDDSGPSSSSGRSLKSGDTSRDPDLRYDASGVKHSLHGVVYQLKLLMLFLRRGLEEGYTFRLATEMDAAEKFDDLVFRFEGPGVPRPLLRFLQAKHKQDEDKKIGIKHLIKEEEGEFGLYKYFISYREIKNNPVFADAELVDLILCTNIGFNKEELKNEGIELLKIRTEDKLLDVTCTENTLKEPARYRLKAVPNSELFTVLKGTSEKLALAKMLAEHFLTEKVIDLRSRLTKRYHLALARDVINTKSKRFDQDFVDNINLGGQLSGFRQCLFHELKSLHNGLTSDKEVQGILRSKKLNLTNSFGKKPANPQSDDDRDLPDDDVSDADIEEFLEKLVFAVNQPNEMELGEIIKHEMGSETKLNLLDSDLVGDLFLREMLDWFKEKGGRYLTNEEGNEIFNSVESKIETLMAAGLSLAYPETIKSYGVEFTETNQDLNYFLTEDRTSGIFNLVTTGLTLLGSIKVHQTIKETELYKKRDSLIFLRLKTLRSLDIQKTVFESFGTTKSHHLLVIECEPPVTQEDKKILYVRIPKTLKSKTIKKVVLITENGDPNFNCEIYDYIGVRCIEKEDFHSEFTNLTNSSQNHLLQNSADFQGEMIPLNKIIRAGSMKFVNSLTLGKLIKKETIYIGNKIKGLGEISDYYLPRTLVYEWGIQETVLKDKPKDMYLALSGIKREKLQELASDSQDIIFFGEIKSGGTPGTIIILDEESERRQYSDLQEYQNIHWLKWEDGSLIWQQSKGPLDKLRRFLAQGFILRDEDYLLEKGINHRLLLLSDKAGMGKSTLLTNLATRLKRNYPDRWLIKVDLNNYTYELEKELLRRSEGGQSFDPYNSRECVEYLITLLRSNEESKLKTELEENLFRLSFESSDSVILLVDGFDEISPDYKEIVLELLQGIILTKAERLWITTRPHLKEFLEWELNILSCNFEPLSVENQIEFFKTFWDRSRKDIETPFTIPEDYGEKLGILLRECIYDSEKQFCGIPLQTRMVAEVFESKLKEGDITLPTRLDIMDLYEIFIEKKFKIYQVEKNEIDTSKPGVKEEKTYLYKKFIQNHQYAALYTVLGSEKWKRMVTLEKKREKIISTVEKIQRGKERTGIIDGTFGNNPNFIHRSFAEYFSAEFILNQLDKIDKEFIITDIMVKEEYNAVRAFFDEHLKRTPIECNLEEYGEVIVKYWRENPSALKNEDGSNLVSTSTEEGNKMIIDFMLKCLKGFKETLYEILNGQCKYGFSALHAASQRGEWEILKSLIEAGGDANAADEDGNKLINDAAACGRWDVVRYLMEKGVDVKAEDPEGNSVLAEAVEHGEIEMVRLLLEKGLDLNGYNTSKRRAVHIASFQGHTALLDYLLTEGADVNVPDGDERTPLHFAANQDRIESMRLLVHRGADPSAKDADGRTALHVAASQGRFEAVKFLVGIGVDITTEDNDGRTVFNEAEDAGRPDIVQWLSEQSSDGVFQV